MDGLLDGLLKRVGLRPAVNPWPEVSPAPPAAPTPDEVIAGLERRVMLGDAEVVVRPLVWEDYERVSRDIGGFVQRIVTEHPEVDLQNLQAHVSTILPLLLTQVGLRLFAALVGAEEELLRKHMTLAVALRLFVAVLEVNELPDIRKNAERALQMVKGLAKSPVPIPPTP
jgi:hypothetical protein